MGNEIPVFTQSDLSDSFTKAPIYAWMPEDNADISFIEIEEYSDDESYQVVDSLSSLDISSSLQATLISIFATVLYRYSYQDELEVHYFSGNSENLTEFEESVKCLRLDIQTHATDTTEKIVHYCSDELSSDSRNLTELNSLSQITYCLIELKSNEGSVLNNIKEVFAQNKGKIWPIIVTDGNNLKLTWLFDKRIPLDCIKSLQSHVLSLTKNIKKKPEVPMYKQAMLTELEVQRQIAFSQGTEYVDEALPLYKKIENHAETRPNHVALIYENTKLTYAQLNTQANRLAYKLLSKNIVPGSAIAVYIKPSTNILVAILAIHKIGCVYVPIDPGFPTTRVNTILQEVNPVIILLDEQSKDIPAQYSSICHDLADIDCSVSSESNPDVSVTLDDVSHIYFTSGTTGKPKGVVATHHNLVHYISSAINRYGFNQNDTFLACARFTFSISMFELLTPLVAGGCVRVLPKETVLDLNQLSRAVASATVFHFGPSLLKQLLPYIEVNYSSYDVFDKLTHVSSGGDMVPPEILEKLKKIFRNAEVYVIYGSSEISCMGCTYEVPRDRAIKRTLVGGPHQNVKVRIFDRNGNMVPIGVPGNVYFSGKGLVREYLNSPQLTEEKFIMIEGERFYSIGDIGRLDQDGNLELLGREDYQVQIRGMRVELLEVEACLKRHPAIIDCVVISRNLQKNCEKSLIAYLVLKKDVKITASELNTYVGNFLPDYMIPAVFVKLDKLPTNHNAKLDRSQLPHPNSANIIISGDYQVAVNEVEQKLIDIWKNLFNIENIGVDHNFFELGGDSLLAVSYLYEVDKVFNKIIPISRLMDAPTIRDIAKIITSDKPVEEGDGVVVLKRGNSKPPLFCLYGVVLYKNLAECLDTERMICSVYFEEEATMRQNGEGSDAFKALLNVGNVATRYLKSIQAFQPKGPYYLCGQSFGGILALEVARKLEQQGEKVQLVAMFDTFAPGYLKSISPLARIAIHLRKIKQLDWPYLKQKLLNYTRRIELKPNSNNDPFSGLEDIHGKARERVEKYYLPETYQEKVVLFRARERSVFESELKNLGWRKSELEDLGWGKFIQNLEVHEINGNHLGILENGHVENMASIIREKMV